MKITNWLQKLEMKLVKEFNQRSLMRKIVLIVFCLISLVGFSQEIEQNWKISSIKKLDGTQIVETKGSDTFSFLEGKITISFTEDEDEILGSGNYIRQNNLLIFNLNEPKDTVRYYNIISFNDQSLVLSENEVIYTLFPQGQSNILTPENESDLVLKETSISKTKETSEIIPSQGFSIKSLWKGALGMLSLIIITFFFSSNRKAINWKKVGIGLSLQLLIAIGVLKVQFIQSIFEFIGGIFIEILEYTKAGSEFLFAGMVADTTTFGYIFAFQVLPTIIFFSALTSLFFYLGIIQKIVKLMAIVLTKFLGISGMESLSVAGNIFLGQTEAPLLIKAYLEKMNKSEMLLVMIGGMATVAGAVLAAYIGFLGGGDKVLELVFAKHLLAASVMAAPGAIVISKILYPQTEKVSTDVSVSQEKIGSNILDAIANGTTEGLRLAVNVGAMLLVFVAVIAMLNGILGWVGDVTTLNSWMAENTENYTSFSIEAILGYTFAPLMWLIGVAYEDMALMGQLLGIKLAASEFVGYIQLAELKNIANATHLTYNKSIIMATYMLCGFANFASIGIQIGGIGSLAPGQRKTLSEFGMKALIGGTIASLMSATIAGMIIG
ncbi:MAG: Putative nucleoside permease NupX [Polaribacter sp. SA4-10]|nr:MAG: Putative nucleoside permease NupX [Polaribacter sp. SA4-10]